MATIEDLQEDLSNLKPILEVYSGLLTDFKKDLSFYNKTVSLIRDENSSGKATMHLMLLKDRSGAVFCFFQKQKTSIVCFYE